MSDNKKYNQIGKDIEKAVKEGLASGDWSKVGLVISDSVDTVLDDVGEQVKKMNNVNPGPKAKNLSSYQGRYSAGDYTRQRQQKLEQEKRERARQKAEKERREAAQKAQKQQLTQTRHSKNEIMVPMKQIGNYSSTLSMVGGGIGMGITAVSLVTSLPSIIMGSASVPGLIVGGVFTAAFAVLLNVGIANNKKLKLAQRYAIACGTKGYVEIDDLVRLTGRRKKQVIRDIKKLLRDGYYPEGRLDDSNDTLILTNAVYAQYLESKRNEQAKKEAQIIDTTSRVVEDDAAELSSAENAELAQMIAEGNDYILRLHELNEEIPGEVITAKLTRLEGLLTEIFARVEEHPEQMPKMHELMDYYLPTMIKLVSAYSEYDKISEPDKSIIEAKEDIENTLDTINSAFRKLLNNLFKESVWDVTTDAQVLKTMLAQKGL